MSDSQNRDDLLQKLERADAENADIEKSARELLTTVVHQRDINKAFADTIKTLPNDAPVPQDHWSTLHAVADRQAIQRAAVRAPLRDVVTIYGASAEANIATVTSTAATVVGSLTYAMVEPSSDAWYNEKYLPRQTVLNQVVQQTLDRQHLEGLLREFGLDRDKGDVKNALLRLQEAYSALNQANTELATASSILIPLRDCIEAIVSLLLPLRPIQEKAGGLSKNIQSIGKQCKRDHLADEDFTALGAQAAMLHRLYSDAKDKRVLRDEVLTRFNAGLALIQQFLHGLDKSKFRQRD
jgi:hypothetical protein